MKTFFSQSWFKLGFLIGLAILIYNITGDGIFSSKITTFPVLCQNELPTISDCVDATKLNKTTYKVDTEKQHVISWLPGYEKIALIEQYTKCVVLDVKNWTCTYDDGSGKFGFNNGNYVEESGSFSNISINDIYVSAAQWERADGKVDYLEEISP